MDKIDMTIPAKFADHLKVFEKLVQPTIVSRDKIHAKYRGTFPTKEEEKKFDELNERVDIIQELLRLAYATISIAGVTGAFGEEFLKEVKKDTLDVKKFTERAEKLYGYTLK